MHRVTTDTSPRTPPPRKDPKAGTPQDKMFQPTPLAKKLWQAAAEQREQQHKDELKKLTDAAVAKKIPKPTQPEPTNSTHGSV